MKQRSNFEILKLKIEMSSCSDSESSSSSSSFILYYPSDEEKFNNSNDIDDNNNSISEEETTFLELAHEQALKVEENMNKRTTLSPISIIQDTFVTTTTTTTTTPFSTRYFFRDEDKNDADADETFLSIGEVAMNAESVVTRSRRTSALRRLDNMAKQYRFEMINRAFEKLKLFLTSPFSSVQTLKSCDKSYDESTLLPPVPSSSSSSSSEDEDEALLQDLTTRLASVTLLNTSSSSSSSPVSPSSSVSSARSFKSPAIKKNTRKVTCYNSLSIRSSPGMIKSPKQHQRQQVSHKTIGYDRDSAVRWMQERSEIASGSSVRSQDTNALMYIFETFMETVRSQTLLIVPCVSSLNAWYDMLRKRTKKTFCVYRKGTALNSRVLDADIILTTYSTVSLKECLVSSSFGTIGKTSNEENESDRENVSWFSKKCNKKTKDEKGFRSRLHRIRFGHIFFILNDRLSNTKMSACVSLYSKHRWSLALDDTYGDKRIRMKLFETAMKVIGLDDTKAAIARLAIVTDDSMTNDTRFPVFSVRCR